MEGTKVTPTGEDLAAMAAAEPQPDRSLVAPLVQQLAATRGSLTQVANWLHGFWPEHLPAGNLHRARVGFHATTAADLLAARTALDAIGQPVIACDEGIVTAVVALDGVDVVVQSHRSLWFETYPEEAVAV